MRWYKKRVIAFLLSAAMLLSCGQSIMAVAAESCDAPSSGSALPASESKVLSGPAASESSHAPSGETPEGTSSSASSVAAASAASEAACEVASSGSVSSETPDAGLFPGMPVGYALDEEQIAEKQNLNTYQVLDTVENMLPGTDYADGEVLLWADDAAYAKTVAAAYGSTLKDYANNVAVISLPQDVTVPDAIAAACDMENNLPAVSINEMIPLDPEVYDIASFALSPDMVQTDGILTQAPTESNWQSWMESHNNSDPSLSPTAADYQWQHTDMGDFAAWGTTTGSGIKVAVLDTGVDDANTDLAGKVIEHRYYESGDNGISSTGTVKRLAGNHGTHVAGIIAAAADNGTAGAGIAPDVQIYDYCVFQAVGSGTTAYTSSIIGALNQCVIDKVNVVNMSLGSSFYNSTFQQAVQNAVNSGIVIVASAGNDGSNIRNYPACYPNVICVGAVNRSNLRANFSDYGSQVTLSAPGVDIYSTLPDSNGADAFGYMSGTSQASPMVAGAVALYQSIIGDQQGDVNSDGVRDAKDVAAVTAALKKATIACGSSGMGAGVVNTEKLMENVTGKPTITILVNGTEVPVSGAAVTLPASCTATLAFDVSGAASGNNYFYAYTLDGTAPKFVNGAVVGSAQGYTGPIDLTKMADGRYTVRVLAVNAAGICSAVVSRAFTLQHNAGASVTGGLSNNIMISGPKYVARGRGITLSAALTNLKGGIVWSVPAPVAGISVNSRGTITASSKAVEGSFVVVRASLAGNPQIYQEYTVTVTAPITAISLHTEDNAATTLNTASVLQLQATVTGPSTYGLKWTSSNAKIATVDSAGKVTATQTAGSVTITAAAQDGTGAKASIRITVAHLVTGITLSASTDIPSGGSYTPGIVARGASITFSAVVAPTYAGNRAVSWSIDDAAKAAGVTISSSGKLSVPASAGSVANVTVTAAAKDGSNVTASRTVSVCSTPTRSVTLGTSDADGGRLSWSRSALTAARLFTVSLSGTAYDVKAESALDEATLMLVANTADGSAPIYWSSNNSAVASVANGKIVAHAVGTATITARAMDGSNRAASIRVTVVQPVTAITVASSSLYAAAGTSSVKCTAAVSNASSKSYSWAIDAAAKAQKIGISSSGTLSVPRSYTGISSVRITATAKDGSNVFGSVIVQLNAQATTAVALDVASADNTRATRNAKTSALTGIALFNTNPSSSAFGGSVLNEQAVTLLATVANNNSGTVPLKWSASNSSIVSLVPTNNGASCAVTALKPGSCRVTALALDGSNRSSSVQITVTVPVSSIVLSNANSTAYVSSGKSVALKAAVTAQGGAKPTNASVIWSATNGATVKNGVVSVPASVSAGTTILVSAAASDKSGISSQAYTLAVAATPTAKGLLLRPSASGAMAATPKYTTIKGLGQLSYYPSATLFTYNVSSSTYGGSSVDETTITMGAHGYTASTADLSMDGRVVWSSSRASVASVDAQTGKVKAVGAGTATIRATAIDGSGASASFTVKVLVPVSDLTINAPSNRYAYAGDTVLAKGTSAVFSAGIGAAYGTPSLKQVKWEISDYVGSYLSSGDRYSASRSSPGNFAFAKYYTLNSSGKLSISSSKSNTFYGTLTLKATTTDGTGLVAIYTVTVGFAPTTAMNYSSKTKLYYVSNGRLFYSGCYYTNSSSFSRVGDNMYVFASNCYVHYGSNGEYIPICVTSSNPGAASADSSATQLYGYWNSGDLYLTTIKSSSCFQLYDSAGVPLYAIVVSSPGERTGLSRITISVADGTNRSCAFTVKVVA